MSEVVLTTERLTLSQLSEADAPFILALLNEPSFIANIGDRNLRDEAAARAYIADAFTATYARLGFGFWKVTESATGEPVGIAGLLLRDYLDAPDVGYALFDRFAGRGFATEATAGVLAYARDRLGLRRVVAFTTPANVASQRVLEKAGMVRERIFTRPDEATPMLLYAAAWPQSV